MGSDSGDGPTDASGPNQSQATGPALEASPHEQAARWSDPNRTIAVPIFYALTSEGLPAWRGARRRA